MRVLQNTRTFKRVAIRTTAALGIFIALLTVTMLWVAPASAQTTADSTGGTVPPPPLISVDPFLDGFENPIYLTHAGDNSGRIFIVERAGKIHVWFDGQVRGNPFLDIVGKVNSTCSECGLLGLAFPPNFAESGEFYISYTANADVAPPIDGEPETGNDSVLARYRITDDLNIADPDSEEIILAINQPFRNHNGGMIEFGPDGHLYVGMGDGGSGGDPFNYAQNLERLLGKMLRISVTGVPTYTIPADNPFVSAPTGEPVTLEAADGTQITPRPEIWAYGLRNPWRWSFDRDTGDLWIGDVGQGSWEEVNFQSQASAGGENYGWRIMEGNHCYSPATGCPTTGLTMPVFEYANMGGAAVTGGYVYRGTQTPLVGTYIVGDFGSGMIWGLTRDPGGDIEVTELLNTSYNIASFGEDEFGELYLVDYAGGIYRINVPSFERPYRLLMPWMTKQVEP